MLRARYDAASYNTDDKNHWAQADDLSARWANSPEVRRVMRRRSRYERGNNSYLDGITLTLADDVVGTGPRLHCMTPDDGFNKAISEAFECWSCCAGLSQKLHTMRQARSVDGEGFLVMVTNPELDDDVKLDLWELEAEQVSTPFPSPTDPLAVDGVELDQYGNPRNYIVLRYHPGDLYSGAYPTAFDRVPADLMLHWFQKKRPQQFRGIPDSAASLMLFGQLRRYTLAVLAGAETAADFAAILQSDMPPDVEDFDNGTPFENLEITKRMMTTVPAGWKMNQFKPEQPTTTYPQFKHEIINEAARCQSMPFNIAAGNSSGYNYSSGRLDHQTYYKSIRVDRHRLTILLDRIFAQWLAEAKLATDLIPADFDAIPHKWFFDGLGHIDPTKDATADTIRLANGTTTLAEICARDGKDWQEVLEQRAKEIARMTALGIPLPAPTASKPAAAAIDHDELMEAAHAYSQRNGRV